MVIQRWQTVLLLAAAALMACFTFCSLGQIQLPDYTCNFTTFGFEIEGEATDGARTGFVVRTWSFFIVSLMSFVIPFLAIFCYKNLKLQKSLCWISILFTVAAAVIGGTVGYATFEGAAVSWSSLALAPLLAIIAVYMAYRRIRSDERKLRAADRLR